MPEVASKSSDPMIGVTIDGRYRVTDAIGAGGMGSVYLATQINIDRDVAIKVLAAGFSGNDDVVRRFENEARIISQLRHPNTLKLIDFGRMSDGRLFIVTEFLSGAPLNNVLAAGTLTPVRTLRMISEICASLVEAHAKGIIHRDLKPGNIFIEKVGDEEVIKVLDFGIAKLSEQPAVTRTGTLFGTPAYMAPEQARGTGVDGRSDIYSLGILVYECLTGRPPFTSENMAALLVHHIMEAPPPIQQKLPDLPPEVAELVMSMLAKDPKDRPQSAAELRRHAEKLGRKIDTQSRSLPPGPPSEQPTGSADISAKEALAATRSSARPEASRPESLALSATIDSLRPPSVAIEPPRPAGKGKTNVWIAGGVVVAAVVAVVAMRSAPPEVVTPPPVLEAKAPPQAPVATPVAAPVAAPVAEPVAEPIRAAAKPAKAKPRAKPPEATQPPPGFVAVP